VAPTTDRIGHIINQRYEVRDVIGRGGQGMVYRALDRWMERAVAIKVLSSKAAKEPQMAERLIREQQALSALKGTAAVELFDVCRGNDGELCLVMELLVGMDLDDYLYSIEERRERIDLPRVAEIFDPIVDTLEVAHNAGILHRDLKPANVFLLEGGGVRLLDFGMARLKKAAPLTAAGTIMGSPSFMAPEAWKGQSALVDHRADVYSLGVILFRVLAGDLPFAGESLHEKFLGSTKSARPSLLKKRPDLPRHADDWVAQALAIDPGERFQNVRALWNAFLSTFHVKAPKRGKKGPGFWTAARGAVQKLARGSDKPPPVEPAPRTSEPSFGREALAQSVLQRPTTDPEAPRLLDPSKRPPSAPPGKKPPAPPRPRSAPPAEATIELTDVDLSQLAPPPPRSKPVEKTLELNEADLVAAENTMQQAPAPVPPPPPPRASGSAKPASSRKRGERSKPGR
jgi:eukaryotic-like serine/threonine-protein kinase